MRIAWLALLATGCLTNNISGQWTGCDPGDQIYLSVPNDAADWFACEQGEFDLDVAATGDFALRFKRDDATGEQVEYFEIRLSGVDGDRDIGLVQF